MVAMVAADAASHSDRKAASLMSRLFQAASYHRKENPPHTATDSRSLNENTMSSAIGA